VTIQTPIAETKPPDGGRPFLLRAGQRLTHRPVIRQIAAVGLGALRRLDQRRAMEAYLRDHPRRRLLVGAGVHDKEGWLCVDLVPVKRSIVYMNAIKPFPLPSASFDMVHSEHMIEHITFTHAAAMLSECHRILRPGGVVRIATPDLRKITELLNRPDDTISDRYVRWSNSQDEWVSTDNARNPVFVVNGFLRKWGHTFVFDEPTLAALLRFVGFTGVRRLEPGESDTADLVDVERHGELIGEEFNRFETMVLEATAPCDHASTPYSQPNSSRTSRQRSIV
jgi:predicted SAM-dependent methyltransferase